jgi:hypothetical protein
MLNAKAKKNTTAGMRTGVSGANTLQFVATE